MRAIFPPLAIAVMFLAMGVAFGQEPFNSPTVLLSPQAPNQQFEGVKEVSLVTPEGKVHPCMAELGDRIEILMIDLDLWLQGQRKHITSKEDAQGAEVMDEMMPLVEHIPTQEGTQGAQLIEEMLPRMVLVLDGKAMTTLHAVRPSEDPLYAAPPTAPADAQPPPGRWFSVQFALTQANPRRFLTDLLSDDGNTVTFNRFQIVVWTLVLGVIFASEVLTRLAMPAFGSTLLVLMGISSGAYVGFRFASDKPTPRHDRKASYLHATFAAVVPLRPLSNAAPFGLPRPVQASHPGPA